MRNNFLIRQTRGIGCVVCSVGDATYQQDRILTRSLQACRLFGPHNRLPSNLPTAVVLM